MFSPRCGTSGPAVQNPEEIIWRGFVDPEAVSRSLKLPPSYRDIVRFCCGQGRHLTCRSEAGRAEVEAPTIRMLEPECQFLEASQAEHRALTTRRNTIEPPSRKVIPLLGDPTMDRILGATAGQFAHVDPIDRHAVPARDGRTSVRPRLFYLPRAADRKTGPLDDVVGSALSVLAAVENCLHRPSVARYTSP